MSDRDPPESSADAQEHTLSVQSMETLLARAQHLIDSRPQNEYPVAWFVEASLIGDLPAIAALATIASRSAQKAS